jgi:hypothetical protein
MGFRDLHLFNKAMLGKQGWRLITRPDNLCAKVLKGRYFHDGNFLSSTRKKHASHTWRSILAGKAVLVRGLIKRIGDGSSTHIWNDRWIPMHFDARTITPNAGHNVNRVSELMTKAGRWNEDLIKSIFLPIDARAILRIPVRPQEDDWWAWEPEKHGEYTVKSAHRKLTAPQPFQASASGDESWKRIWKLQVPPKVKVFCWRVLHEFIPTKDVLQRRHIEPTSFCEICGADRESIKHTLTECTVARIFWQEMRSLYGAKLP